jgi:hypothetical protein
MHGLTGAFSLISTLVPSQAAAAKGSSASADVAPLVVAQNAPSSPPPVGTEAAPAPAATPAPGWAPPAATAVGSAPALKGLSPWLVANNGSGYYGYGFGVGASFLFPLSFPPIFKNGRIHDIWAIEAGLDITRHSYAYYGCGVLSNCSDTASILLTPYANVMWQVWLNESFAVYPKAGLGYGIRVSGNDYCGSTAFGCSDAFPLRIDGGGGVLYRTGALTLRGEVGYDGIRGGLGFFF